ncbi:MAG: hypothetical protein HZB16_16140 [Armatimonadetes bacterium]|nr:hypothetical protein [Armatimonadota bacterium]
MSGRWLGIILGAVLALGCARAEVVIDPPRWDLDPPLAAGQTIARAFAVTNRGRQAVRVLQVTADAALVPGLARTTLLPGQPVTLRVMVRAVEPAKVPLTLAAEVRLDLDSPAQPQLRLPVAGRVVSAAEASPVPQALRPGNRVARPGQPPVHVEVFWNSGCGACNRFMDTVVTPLRQSAGEAVKWHLGDLLNPAEFARARRLRRGYGLTAEANTYAFVGRHALHGEAIDAELPGLLLAELRQPSRAPARVALELAGGADETGLPRLGAGSLLSMLGLGALDGLNPCAFATAVFLLALLTRLGGDRRTLLLAGGTYALAVFVTYTLLGLGLISALDLLGSRRLAADLLRWSVAAVALAGALTQTRDVLALRRGTPTRELEAQLPTRLKLAVHGLLRGMARPGLGRLAVAVGAGVAGVGVTLIEMVCTSQVYLPVLVGLKQPALRARALPLLLAYNVGFVVPLLVVLSATWRGTGSARAAAWAKAHLGSAKLALALLMAGLAVWLLRPELHL